MKIKSVYVCPETVQIFVQPHGLMDSLSMGVSEDPAYGGGDAKRSFVIEDFESSQTTKTHSLWD